MTTMDNMGKWGGRGKLGAGKVKGNWGQRGWIQVPDYLVEAGEIGRASCRERV